MARKRKKRANRKAVSVKPKVAGRMGEGMAPAVVVSASEVTYDAAEVPVELGQTSLFEMLGFEAEVDVEAKAQVEEAAPAMTDMKDASDNPQGALEGEVEPAPDESSVDKVEAAAEPRGFAKAQVEETPEELAATGAGVESQVEDPTLEPACEKTEAQVELEAPEAAVDDSEVTDEPESVGAPELVVESELADAPEVAIAEGPEPEDTYESVEELLADSVPVQAEGASPDEPTSELPAGRVPAPKLQPRMTVDIQQLGANELPVAPLMVPASDLLAGAVRTEAVARGWVRPWRFFVAQVRAQESCLAWYPGIYRQMVRCSAGMCLEFETDATEFAVELRVDPEPRATRKVLRAVDGDFPEPHDGISVEVDGQRLACFMPASTVAANPVPAKMGECLKFNLNLNNSTKKAVTDMLPGMGDTHLVRLWLPALRGCELGRVAASGSQLKACERPVSSGLLVLGDSVSQGFVVDDPASTWPVLASKRLGMPLLNQSVGAQVFQPSALSGLDAIKDPELIVVALGANYRYGRCNSRLISREIGEYLGIVDRMFPEAPLIVVPPAPAEGRQVASGSCYAEVPEIVRAAAVQLKRRRVADGHAALVVAEVPALWNRHVADADGHPTAEGAALFADVVCAAAEQFACRCLRDLGTFGRCGACVRG